MVVLQDICMYISINVENVHIYIHTVHAFKHPFVYPRLGTYVCPVSCCVVADSADCVLVLHSLM